MTPAELLDNLTLERSFADLWRLTRKLRSAHVRLYRLVVLVVVLVVFVCAFVSGASAYDVGVAVRKTNETAFGFAGTTFGILLAGFAIFATIGTSDAAQRLALFAPEARGMSELKFMSLHFVKAFAPFLAFFAFAFLIMSVGFYGGPATWIAGAVGPLLARAMASLFLALVTGFVAHLLIVLCSFLFNVHTSLMMMVRVRLDPNLKDIVEDAIKDLESKASATEAPLGESGAILAPVLLASPVATRSASKVPESLAPADHQSSNVRPAGSDPKAPQR